MTYTEILNLQKQAKYISASQRGFGFAVDPDDSSRQATSPSGEPLYTYQMNNGKTLTGTWRMVNAARRSESRSLSEKGIITEPEDGRGYGGSTQLSGSGDRLRQIYYDLRENPRPKPSTTKVTPKPVAVKNSESVSAKSARSVSEPDFASLPEPDVATQFSSAKYRPGRAYSGKAVATSKSYGFSPGTPNPTLKGIWLGDRLGIGNSTPRMTITGDSSPFEDVPDPRIALRKRIEEALRKAPLWNYTDRTYNNKFDPYFYNINTKEYL